MYLGSVLIGPPPSKTSSVVAAPNPTPAVEPVPASPIPGSAPPWAKMAVIDAGGQPAAGDLRRFERAFILIARGCPDPPDRLGDFLVAGHAHLRDEKGLRVSLLTFTESVARVMEPLVNKGADQRESCSGIVALLATTITAD